MNHDQSLHHFPETADGYPTGATAPIPALSIPIHGAGSQLYSGWMHDSAPDLRRRAHRPRPAARRHRTAGEARTGRAAMGAREVASESWCCCGCGCEIFTSIFGACFWSFWVNILILMIFQSTFWGSIWGLILGGRKYLLLQFLDL